MRVGTDYRTVWTLAAEEEHAASREAARYLEQVEEAAHVLGADTRHGFLAEVHDDYTRLEEDWHDLERTEEASYDHRVLDDFDISYGLDDGGCIRFEYDREAVPNQFRLRIVGSEQVRETLQDALGHDLKPTMKRQIGDILSGSRGREPCPHCDEEKDAMDDDADHATAVDPYDAGDAAVVVEGGRSFTGPYLRGIRVDVETEDAALEYHLTGRGAMWMHASVPTGAALGDRYDLPVLDHMAGGDAPHTVPMQPGFKPVQEDGTVTYRAGVEEDGTTTYTFHYAPRPAGTVQHPGWISYRFEQGQNGTVTCALPASGGPEELIRLFFNVIEAEAGIPADAGEEALAASLNEAGIAHPRQEGTFSGESIRDSFGI